MIPHPRFDLLILVSALVQVALFAAAFLTIPTGESRRARLMLTAIVGFYTLRRFFGAMVDVEVDAPNGLRVLEEIFSFSLAASMLVGARQLAKAWAEHETAMKDATTREARRQESEELWQRVFEFTPDGYMLLDLEGRLLRTNRALLRMTGLRAEQVEGKRLQDLPVLPPRTVEQAERDLAVYRSGGSLRRTDFQFLTASGELRSAEVAAYRIEGPEGPLLLTLVHDVTERLQTEARLRASRMLLEEAQRVAKLVTFEADVATAVATLVDNPRAAHPIDEHGETLDMQEVLSYVVPEDRDRVLWALAEGLMRDTNEDVVVEFRATNRRTGERNTVRTTVRAERDANGLPVRVYGATLDITDIRKAEQEIRELNAMLEQRVQQRTAELERTVEELEAFSYSVSHDLRSPLRAMAGYSTMVLERDASSLSAESREHLQRIHASSVRMGNLIDGLLSLSRLTRRPIDRSVFDLSAKANAIVAELRAGEPGRQVKVEVEPGLVAYADRALVGLVLQNLLSNSWKFTHPVGDAHIRLGQAPGGPFFVRDNGVGFEDAQAGKLFRPFERLHHSDEFEGTGIGLATVARAVRHHGGRVWAQGEPGHGATFWFTLGQEALVAPAGPDGNVEAASAAPSAGDHPGERPAA